MAGLAKIPTAAFGAMSDDEIETQDIDLGGLAPA